MLLRRVSMLSIALGAFLFSAGATHAQFRPFPPDDKKPTGTGTGTGADKKTGKSGVGDKKTSDRPTFEIKTLKSYTGYLGTSVYGPGSTYGPYSNPFTPSYSNPFSTPYTTPGPSTSSWSPPMFQQNPWSNPFSNNFWNSNPMMNNNPFVNSPLNNNPWGNPWSNSFNNNPWGFSPNSNPWGAVQWNNPFQPGNFFQAPGANPFAPFNPANPWNNMLLGNGPGIGAINPNPFNPNPFGMANPGFGVFPR